MKFSLLPKENVFYQLLETLSTKAELAVQLFKKLIDEWNHAHPLLQDLKDLEHECDQIVHEIMVKLNKTFVTPIDREDIHHLAKKIDDLIDILQSLSERMVLFQVQSIEQDLKEMTIVLEKSISILVHIVPKIRDLSDSNVLFESCIQIHTLENEGDRIYETALGKLFLPARDPLDVIKWKEIYDFLESAIDTSEDIADILWGIAVKYG
jgi:uncharacterized protein